MRTALDVLAAIPRVGRAAPSRSSTPSSSIRRTRHASARIGVAASVQACHLLSDAAGDPPRLGRRAARAFPLADLDRGGALLPLGTDAPVEPPDPWRGIVAAVARRGADAGPTSDALAPEQALASSGRSGRPASTGRARSGSTDLGHLGPGAVADLIVVPAAPLDDPAGPRQPLAALPTDR